MIKESQLLDSPLFINALNQCIHCGMCLQACPTYKVFGTEMDSPRGRIALMRAGSENTFEPDLFFNSFERHITLCLACRACETACPSGVKYGQLIEGARYVVEANRSAGILEKFSRWVSTKQVMPHRNRIRLLSKILFLYQSIGLQKIIRKHSLLPKSLNAMEAILPELSNQFNEYTEFVPAFGNKKGEVLFFPGCVQEGFLPQVNHATSNVLRWNGYDVFTPPDQTCCGAAHAHLGDLEFAKKLARKNIDAFLSSENGHAAVINNAGGCGAALKEYPHLLADDPVYYQKAQEFSNKVMDINEFLVENLNTLPAGDIPIRATYSDSCHLRHGQRVVEQPRELLQKIPGLVLIELTNPDLCCGSAGVYNITQVETAQKILAEKIADIKAAGVELVVTSNTGCQMQLIAGIRNAGLEYKVMHVAEVLDWSYNKGVKR
jgi:glycolate oxidase iron-sulfur subunit